jgi:hypothetical protein
MANSSRRYRPRWPGSNTPTSSGDDAPVAEATTVESAAPEGGTNETGPAVAPDTPDAAQHFGWTKADKAGIWQRPDAAAAEPTQLGAPAPQDVTVESGDSATTSDDNSSSEITETDGVPVTVSVPVFEPSSDSTVVRHVPGPPAPPPEPVIALPPEVAPAPVGEPVIAAPAPTLTVTPMPPPVAPVAPVAPVTLAKTRPQGVGKPKQKKRRPRHARLRISHIGILSLMRTALMFSIAIGIVLFVALVAVWTIIDQSGVLGNIQTIVDDLVGAGGTSGLQISAYLDTQRVIGFAAFIGVANAILMTLLITIFGALYNAVAAILGGIMVTLSED